MNTNSKHDRQHKKNSYKVDKKDITGYFQMKYDFESTLYMSMLFNPLTNIISTI
jgi:hypothetical protein